MLVTVEPKCLGEVIGSLYVPQEPLFDLGALINYLTQPKSLDVAGGNPHSFNIGTYLNSRTSLIHKSIRLILNDKWSTIHGICRQPCLTLLKL